VAEGAEAEAAEAKAAELTAEAESMAAAAEAQAAEAEAAQAKAVAAEAVHAQAEATAEARAQAIAAFEGPAGPGGFGPEGPGPGGFGPEGPGPGGFGPEGPGPGGFSTIIEAGEHAAEAAFDQAMLAGGSLEDAFFAATDAATHAGFMAVLDANPTFFGSHESSESVLNKVTDDVILKLTGNIDYLSAGTGSGVGHNDATQRNSQNEIGHLTEDAVGEIAGNFFENILGEDAFVDEGDKFFDTFFDDPFGDFQDQFFFAEDNFFDPDIFVPDNFFFDEGPEDEFFFFDFFVEDPDNFNSDGVVFDSEFELTSGTNNFTGGSTNTEYIVDQAIFGANVYGGNDVINDSGGVRDRITFEGVDNVAISVSEKASDTSRVEITIATNSGAFSRDSDEVTSLLSSPVNTIDITKNVEDLQASDSAFFDFDSGGVLLFGALNVAGSQKGYIVAGSDAQNDAIDLSGFSNSSTTIGSIIFGKGGNDVLTGTVSGDSLLGGPGADTITGGTGADTITGGTGADTIKYTATTDGSGTNGGDTISGFNVVTDRITFANDAFGSLGAGALTVATATSFNTNAGTTINNLAAQDNSEIYQVDFNSGFAFTTTGTGDLAELESDITAATHTGAAFFLISNSDSNTRLYFDANTNAGTDGTGLIHMATLSGIDNAAILDADTIITIV